MTNIPSFFGNEMDEVRKRVEAENALKIKMAYENMVNQGNEWIRVRGEEKLQNRITMIKGNIRGWNQVSKSTIPFTLTSVDTMMMIISMLPFTMSMPELVQNKQYIEMMTMMSAVRNRILAERDKAVKASQSGLSTG